MAVKPTQLGALQTQNPYLNLGSLPGLPGMTRSATGIIQSELGGMPSPSETRTANAAWGVSMGLPPGQGGDFLNQRGSRLYRSEIENRKRQGLQDLFGFLRGYSGTVSATPGQLMDYSQRQQQQSFENAMALWQQQLAQRKLQEANQPIEYSYQTGAPGGQYQGYTEYRNPTTGRLVGRG